MILEEKISFLEPQNRPFLLDCPQEREELHSNDLITVLLSSLHMYIAYRTAEMTVYIVILLLLKGTEKVLNLLLLLQKCPHFPWKGENMTQVLQCQFYQHMV